MASLSIKLLGVFRVDNEDQPKVTFKTSKVRALLAYLAVEANRPHRRDKLAGMFWPESSERRARANLSQTLLMLRQSIRDKEHTPSLLLRERDTIQLNPEADVWVDVPVFCEMVQASQAAVTPEMVHGLETAVALYQGNFLEGFSLGDSPSFEIWCLSRREHLRSLLGKALAQLAAAYERDAQYEHALPYAQRFLELDAWREEAHLVVMRLLALLDRRSEALAQYETCRRIMSENLGIDPMPQTTEQYEAIRDGQFAREIGVGRIKFTTPGFLSFQTPPASHPICVCRESELARLDRLLKKALQGQGQVAFISGEAGSGKTVLWQTFAKQTMSKNPQLLAAAGKSTAYTGLGDPYAAFREVFSQLTGNVATRWAAGTISREQALRSWRALPFAVQALIDSAPELVGTFVSGPRLLERTAEFAQEAQLDGAQRRWLVQLQKLVTRRASESGLSGVHQRALFAQFVLFIATMARRFPLLLVLDDLQWADVGTVSLLFHISRHLAGLRLLLLGAFRPEEIAVMPDGRRHPMTPVLHEIERDLGDINLELGQTADRSFVDALVDSEPNVLDRPFRNQLFRQTGGHPLYTAELLRGLQERDDLYRNESGKWAAKERLDWNTMPPRVEGVIAERIGRLPPEWQKLLQVASVQGESFSGEIAARTLQVDADEALSVLSGALSRDHRLVHAQSFERTPDGNERLSIYQFHHYLFQKYLYDSLDKAEKARLHQITGEIMALVLGDQASEKSVQLAHHFEMGGVPEKAIQHRIEAGKYAIKLLALEEAINHFTRGLALVDALEETPLRNKQEIALQLGLGTGHQLMDGYGSVAAERAYSRARELCVREGESPQLVAALWPLATYATMTGDILQGVKLAEQALSVARRLEDPLFICVAHHHLGWILCESGYFAESVAHQEETIALYDRRYHETMVQMFGHDFGVTSLGWISIPLWHLGYPDEALRRGHEAIALAQSFGHPFSIMHAYVMTALVHILRGELVQGGELGERVKAIATEYGFSNYIASATYLQGAKLVGRGQVVAGVDHWWQSLSLYEADGVQLYHRGTLSAIIEIYAHMGEYELGNKAIAQAESIEADDMASALIENAKGLLLWGQGAAPEDVEACFLRAIAIANRQEAKSLELKATINLCRLWQTQGRREEARKQLAAIYHWFTEGFETVDLQAAAAMLTELA